MYGECVLCPHNDGQGAGDGAFEGLLLFAYLPKNQKMKERWRVWCVPVSVAWLSLLLGKQMKSSAHKGNHALGKKKKKR